MAQRYDEPSRGEMYRGERGRPHEDRGFLERAGEEVRSWFRDDDPGRHQRRSSGREPHRHDAAGSGHAWTGERWDYPERGRTDAGWRPDSRWRSDADRWRDDVSRAEYDRSGAAYRGWNEPNYGYRPAHGYEYDPRSAPDDGRAAGQRWPRNESGPHDDYGRTPPGAGAAHDDAWRYGTGARAGAWSGELARAPRGIYEDDRGRVHQFGHQQEHSFRGRGPKGYRRGDERIREDLCERLTEDAHIDASEMEVAVANGEITLSGAVRSREEKRHAEDLAEMVSGAREVHNNLRVQMIGGRP
jgi:BON domain